MVVVVGRERVNEVRLRWQMMKADVESYITGQDSKQKSRITKSPVNNCMHVLAIYNGSNYSFIIKEI